MRIFSAVGLEDQSQNVYLSISYYQSRSMQKGLEAVLGSMKTINMVLSHYRDRSSHFDSSSMRLLVQQLDGLHEWGHSLLAQQAKLKPDHYKVLASIEVALNLMITHVEALHRLSGQDSSPQRTLAGLNQLQAFVADLEGEMALEHPSCCAYGHAGGISF